MNIFYLDEDPKECAKMHNDKHVVKMCLEYAQILSTAHRVIDGKYWAGMSPSGRKVKRWILSDDYMNARLYKATHINHPSNVWVRQNIEHYNWLLMLWHELASEYTHRYGKHHKSHVDLAQSLSINPEGLEFGSFKEPPCCMDKDCIISGDSVASYRKYYMGPKKHLGVWSSREKPEWWKLSA